MFVHQKAHEISYAIVRIVPYVRRQEFRKRIERLAFQLLEDASAENFESAIKTSASLIALINLGKAIYEIEPMNAKVLIGELYLINSAMRQTIGLEEVAEDLPDLKSFFSKVPVVVEDQSDHSIANNGNGNGIAGAMRQSAILEKIRQSENQKIQVKDLTTSFPEVSERTMRYDLQKLCSQGVLERVGNGGPGSYYALK
jgi:predicted ATPase